MDDHQIIKELLAKGLVVGTAITIPFYVTNYFPPDDGHKHPGHEHVENYTVTSQVMGAPVAVALTGVAATGLVGDLGIGA